MDFNRIFVAHFPVQIPVFIQIRLTIEILTTSASFDVQAAGREGMSRF
jgi:hypothetical protein